MPHVTTLQFTDDTASVDDSAGVARALIDRMYQEAVASIAALADAWDRPDGEPRLVDLNASTPVTIDAASAITAEIPAQAA